MLEDIELRMLVGAVVLALLIFGVGWLVQLSAKRKEEGIDATPPVPGGVWKVSTAIYHWVDLPLMAFIAFVYASPVLVEMVSGPQDPPELTMGAILGTVAMQAFMVALVVGFVAVRKHPVEWMGLRWNLWPLVIPIAIVGVLFTWGLLALLGSVGYYDWLQSKMGEDGVQDVVKAFSDNDDPLLLGLLSLMAVVVAPVSEEVLFRGYLYPVAKRFIGRVPAILFGALVFAVAHNNAQALLPLFVLAVIMTLAYEFTGSLWAPIGIHVLFNGATVAAQFAAKYGLIELPEV